MLFVDAVALLILCWRLFFTFASRLCCLSCPFVHLVLFAVPFPLCFFVAASLPLFVVLSFCVASPTPLRLVSLFQRETHHWTCGAAQATGDMLEKRKLEKQTETSTFVPTYSAARDPRALHRLARKSR